MVKQRAISTLHLSTEYSTVLYCSYFVLCVQYRYKLHMKLKISLIHVLLSSVVIFILTIFCYHHYSSANNDVDSKSKLSSQPLTKNKLHGSATIVTQSSNHSYKEIEPITDRLRAINAVGGPPSVPRNSEKKKIYRLSKYPNGLSWNDFVKYPLEPFYSRVFYDSSSGSSKSDARSFAQLKSLKLHECDMNTVRSLATPSLSTTDYEWCKWALSNDGGRVKVSDCSAFIVRAFD